MPLFTHLLDQSLRSPSFALEFLQQFYPSHPSRYYHGWLRFLFSRDFHRLTPSKTATFPWLTLCPQRVAGRHFLSCQWISSVALTAQSCSGTQWHFCRYSLSFVSDLWSFYSLVARFRSKTVLRTHPGTARPACGQLHRSAAGHWNCTHRDQRPWPPRRLEFPCTPADT